MGLSAGLEGAQASCFSFFVFLLRFRLLDMDVALGNAGGTLGSSTTTELESSGLPVPIG